MLELRLGAPHALAQLVVRWKATAHHIMALLSPSMDGDADWTVGGEAAVAADDEESVLHLGRRLLVCWPAGLADGDVWYYPSGAACEAAEAACGRRETVRISP